MINLYWPIYKNIEKELLELSNYVHFDDKQLSIYSVKISELLIRCAVEIEAVSKELFFKLGGITPVDGVLYFDTQCLQLLEENWHLSKKKLLISAANFYFQDEENRILTPLYKANRRGTSGCKWKQAYQAVKHSRVTNLKDGNLKNLLHALGALFILNIYFKKEIYSLGKDSVGTNFPLNMGSELFNIKLHTGYYYDGENNYGKSKNFDECIYLVKSTEETVEKNRRATDEMRISQTDMFLKHPKYLDYIRTNSLVDYKGDQIMLEVLGEIDYNKMIFATIQPKLEVLKDAQYEAILNKQDIQ